MAFADDFKLFLFTSRKINDSVLNHMVTMQRDIYRLSTIATSWNLRLNPKKCVVLQLCRGMVQGLDQFRYILNGIPLSFVDEYKDLRVTVDVKLQFYFHVHNIVQQIAGLAGNLLRSTVCRDTDFMVTLFKSHVRPIVDYCYDCGMWAI